MLRKKLDVVWVGELLWSTASQHEGPTAPHPRLRGLSLLPIHSTVLAGFTCVRDEVETRRRVLWEGARCGQNRRNQRRLLPTLRRGTCGREKVVMRERISRQIEWRVVMGGNPITSPPDTRDERRTKAARCLSQCFPAHNMTCVLFTDTTEGKIDGVGVRGLGGVETRTKCYKLPKDI